MDNPAATRANIGMSELTFDRVVGVINNVVPKNVVIITEGVDYAAKI